MISMSKYIYAENCYRKDTEKWSLLVLNSTAATAPGNLPSFSTSSISDNTRPSTLLQSML